MSAATARDAIPATRIGVGELAIRLGRALERWGRRHPSAPTRAELERRISRRLQAQAADAEARALVFRATARG
ncbi:hypothetical protein [Protaetiibacter mangrovi]|uniref:Uncharacterized protein n=1 Tax=Protaetiibacter mangrovi TaxID=2970926 RepID=A0ABT1ZH40_9MICO|nr:hypothetical protein [Protaetiibacter mangrovi]MCS0500024.1 hypothetical protein [Protaetiibacter mangrovi]TPX05365.1 hypothetical protein FJ656_06890 [Schumannella luteola]